jgi:hypothetical protein
MVIRNSRGEHQFASASATLARECAASAGHFIAADLLPASPAAPERMLGENGG